VNTLSIIIPVLNEAGRIGKQLEALSRTDGIQEVIVVDGGSSDATTQIVRDHGVALLNASGGRGPQLNRGAERATGDALLFLHADVTLPRDAANVVQQTLDRVGVVAGAFRTRHVDDVRQASAPTWLRLADLRSRYTRAPYGDQALFLRRQTFQKVGGFPEQPLMEDVELCRRLRHLGRIHTARSEVQVSGRRFIEAPLRHFLIMSTYPLLYRAGVSAESLARFYRQIR
jgi:rSAM/selenodomain-associated transferase 2